MLGCISSFPTAFQVQGRLVAMDVNAARLNGLSKMARAQGLADFITIRTGDLREASVVSSDMRGPGSRHQAALPFQFDRVLVDAPCSGLGVLSKRADLRWRRTCEDLDALVALQVCFACHVCLGVGTVSMSPNFLLKGSLAIPVHFFNMTCCTCSEACMSVSANSSERLLSVSSNHLGEGWGYKGNKGRASHPGTSKPWSFECKYVPSADL